MDGRLKIKRLTCNVCPGDDRKSKCPPDKSELVLYTRPVAAQGTTRKEPDKVPTCHMSAKCRPQGGAKNEKEVAKCRGEVDRVPTKGFG